MSDPVWVRRTQVSLLPDPSRVVSLIFLPGQEVAAPGESRSTAVIGRVLALSEREVADTLASLTLGFGSRHPDLAATWESNAALLGHRLAGTGRISAARRLLIGAYFTQEFAVEGAALLNPSMVEHPDQAGVGPGSVRFLMTVRAVGEGHISSVELRTGVVDDDDVVTLDPPPTVAVLPAPVQTRYSRTAFVHQFAELDGAHYNSDFILDSLPTTFTRPDLDRALAELRDQALTRGDAVATVELFERFAASNYEVEFPESSAIQERVLMPRGQTETRGMEDVRLVRLRRHGEAAEYVGTYTAYDGRTVSPQLLRTNDFRRFASEQTSGPGARNKGLALFPRQVGGRYLALSRADRESNSVTASTDLRHWEEPVRVQTPVHPWEIVQLGNCGSPIETDAGWLVLTHGVGPMRTYGIGAVLLDLDDPTVVRGRLARPLLTADAAERHGYVPNVVYSCGAMRHGPTIVLPYGCSDSEVRVALVDVDALLGALTSAASHHPSG